MISIRPALNRTTPVVALPIQRTNTGWYRRTKLFEEEKFTFLVLIPLQGGFFPTSSIISFPYWINNITYYILVIDRLVSIVVKRLEAHAQNLSSNYIKEEKK